MFILKQKIGSCKLSEIFRFDMGGGGSEEFE